MLRRLAIVVLGLLVVVLLALRLWPENTTPYEPGAAALAFADTITIPDMPPDWEWGELESFDGLSLRWGQTGNRDSARATLVYIPGYGGNIRAYGEQFDLWARRGLHVVAMDMRGQGGSEGNPSGDKLPRLVEDGEVLNARDIQSLLATLPRSADRPVVLAGSSYGGLATTLAVLDDPSIADAYLALVPAYHFRSAQSRAQIAGMVRAASALGLSARYGPGQGPWKPFGLDGKAPDFCPTDHPRMFTQLALHIREPEQRVGGLPIGTVGDWIALGDEIVEGERGTLALPTRMILVEGDALVENAPSRTVCDASDLCSYTTWTDATHCVTLDRDELVLRVADEVDALLERVR